MKVKLLSPVRPSDPMDCSLPGSSIHGIFQQEYWSGVPSPAGGVPKPGQIKTIQNISKKTSLGGPVVKNLSTNAGGHGLDL